MKPSPALSGNRVFSKRPDADQEQWKSFELVIDLCGLWCNDMPATEPTLRRPTKRPKRRVGLRNQELCSQTSPPDHARLSNWKLLHRP
jgi:hypothetical protein